MTESRLPYDRELLGGIKESMKVVKKPPFQSVRRWHREFSKKTGSERTKDAYAQRLAQFCAWTEMGPDELIREAQSKAKANSNESWAEELTDDFRSYMEDDLKYSRKTSCTYYGAIRGFFRSNKIMFYKKTPMQWAETRIQPPTKANLMKVRLAASLEGRVAIDICNSLGWRREDIVALTYGMVREDYEKGEDRLFVTFRSQKEEVWAANFIGLEGTESLRMSLETRRHAGEEIKDDTPLLANPRSGAMIPDDLTRFISDLGKAVGIHLTPTHFRKRFRTVAEPIVGPNPTKRMGGWKLSGVGEFYYLPSREETLDLFLQIEGALALSERPTSSKDAALAALRTVAKTYGIDPLKLKIEKLSDRATPERETEVLVEAIKDAREDERLKLSVAGGTSVNKGLATMLEDILVSAFAGAKKRLEDQD